jgi:hypothetical protein
MSIYNSLWDERVSGERVSGERVSGERVSGGAAGQALSY